jgi:hypothetical protein
VLLLTPPGNGAAGRSRTCIGPFRRRMPRLVRPRQRKWSARQELHLRSLGPKPRMLLLHHALETPATPIRASGAMGTRINEPWHSVPRRDSKSGGPEGACTLNPPADNGALYLELRVRKWWEVLVTLQSSLPAPLATPHLQCGSRITSQER